MTSQRFVDVHVFRQGRFSLGRDEQNGGYFLSISVTNRMVDYEEYYRLTLEQYREFVGDEAAARAFAEACRARRHDGDLILQPGSDRGVAAWTLEVGHQAQVGGRHERNRHAASSHRALAGWAIARGVRG